MVSAGNIDSFKPKSVFGVRHIQVFMLFLAMLLSYTMRVNMSIAIVAMTDASNENSFDWSVKIQSMILSSFSWGYVVLQIPSGELAAKFGGAILVTLCVSINAAVSLLIPIGGYYGGWQIICACRVIQGLSQGFLMPSIHNLIGKWVPLEEKSRLGTIIYSGCQMGMALQLVTAGYLADYWGWPAIFYANGTVGAIWTIAYVFFGSDSPQKSKMISAEERLYIQTSLGQTGEQKKLLTPWKSIWTSLPFISLILAHCGHNWGLWTLMTEMPSYMNQVLGVNIKAVSQRADVSALPYLGMYILSFPLGFMSDYVLKKKWLSITTCRKLGNSIGHYGPAIALIGLSYSPVGNVTVAVALLTLVVAISAGHHVGFLLVHIDMAPNFAGTMMGITSFFANLISIFAPIAAGFILKDETNPDDWRNVFYLSSAVYITCNTFFVLFGSSERQSWNEPNDDAESEKKTVKSI